MRFTLQLPTDKVASPDEFLSGAAIGEMARAAEEAGFDAAFVTDHPAPGETGKSLSRAAFGEHAPPAFAGV